jgi:hypothetical protein
LFDIDHFYCGERSAAICIVLSPKKSSTYSNEYASGFSRYGLASGRTSFASSRTAMSDRLLERHLHQRKLSAADLQTIGSSCHNR